MALLSNNCEYIGLDCLNAIEAAARAAVISPARSEAGPGASIAKAVRGVSISSGLSQQSWSGCASPTYSILILYC